MLVRHGELGIDYVNEDSSPAAAYLGDKDGVDFRVVLEVLQDV